MRGMKSGTKKCRGKLNRGKENRKEREKVVGFFFLLERPRQQQWAMKRWRVGGLREQFLLNVVKRESDRKWKRKREERRSPWWTGGAQREEKKNHTGLSKTGREWETDFHPWDQTTTNQPSPLKCKWAASFQNETSAAWEKKEKVTPTPTEWLTAKKLNKLQDFVRTADNLNPWLTKYHFQIAFLQHYIMEILNLENELFKCWHSSLCRDVAQQSIRCQVTTGHGGFAGQFNFFIAGAAFQTYKKNWCKTFMILRCERRRVLQPDQSGSSCCQQTFTLLTSP